MLHMADLEPERTKQKETATEPRGKQVSTWHLMITGGRHAVSSEGGPPNPPFAPIPGCDLKLFEAFFPPALKAKRSNPGPRPNPSTWRPAVIVRCLGARVDTSDPSPRGPPHAIPPGN